MKPTPLLLACLMGIAVPTVGLAQPTITAQPKSQSVSLGAKVTFTVRASGASPFGYQWRHNDAAIPDATALSLVVTNIQSANAGAYTAVVTDALGLSATSQPASLHVDATFTKITVGDPVNEAHEFWGCDWIDYDNDGFADLYVTTRNLNSATRNYLYRNNRDGSFTKVITGVIATDTGTSREATWGDFDNDGFPDVVVGQQPGVVFYRNNGDGTFIKVANPFSGTAAIRVFGPECADYDRDGFLDLFVPNQDGNGLLYRNKGDGTFDRIAGQPIASDQATGTASWADYDNDGWPDLFATGNRNRLWRNAANGRFDKILTGPVVTQAAVNWTRGSWGDYNNDGLLDLFVSAGGHLAAETNALYLNTDNGFTAITTGAIVTEARQFHGSAWGDYDNDGFLDLFVVNIAESGNNFLYHNNGDGTFEKVVEGSLVNESGFSMGRAWGDYDNDGFLDLFVANGGIDGPQKNFLYRNNGNGNAWIKVRCVGTVSNRSAIGAKVRVRATFGGKTFWQLREISSGSGLIAHFGLGNATNIKALRVEWPSGIVQEFRDVAARQMLTLQESVVDISPAKADVSLGAMLTLSVTNAPPDSTLQWRLDGVDITGATNATLEFSSATTNLNGRYTIALSNATGLIFPRPAFVRVFDRPIITSQPQSTNVLVGTNVTLSVTAFSPSPITYQWQFNGVDLPGQTGSTLTLNNVQLTNDGLYTVVATDALRSVTSGPAAVRILIKPVIVQTPLSQSVVAGGSVTFSVEVTGNPAPFTYQWRLGSATLTNMELPGKRAFFTLNNVQANQGGTYRVIIANPAAPTITGSSPTTTWTLTVLPDTDGDGLPDAWETAHGLNPTDAADAELDADGDSQNNLAEYRAGTSPTNAVSYLKLEAVTQTNGQATVSFNAASNQTYTVEWTPDLGGGTWTKLTDLIARPNHRTETVTDGIATDTARFYRVLTPRRP